MDFLYLMFVVAIFIAVILMIEGLYTTWNSTRGPEAKRIARRLQTMANGSGHRDVITIRKQRALSQSEGLERVLRRLPYIDSLDRMLQQAGAEYDVGKFLLVSLGCGVGGFIAGLFLPVPAVVSIGSAVATAVIPLLLVMRKRRLRLARIEEQLPVALDLMSRALRAGHALPSAIEMVGDEIAEPLGAEFRKVFDEVNFGVSMQDALSSLAARVPGTDVGYFVVAVLIQRETGGNLTELLGNIAAIVRARLQLYGQIRALSAEGRLSAWILSVLPFALAGILHVVSPQFVKVLWTDPGGLKMLGGMLVLMVVGIFWMRKLIRIRV